MFDAKSLALPRNRFFRTLKATGIREEQQNRHDNSSHARTRAAGSGGR